MKMHAQNHLNELEVDFPTEAELGLAAKSCQALLELDRLFESGLTTARLQERRREIVLRLNALIKLSTDADAIACYRKTIAMLRARMEFSDMRRPSGRRPLN